MGVGLFVASWPLIVFPPEIVKLPVGGVVSISSAFGERRGRLEAERVGRDGGDV